MTRTTSNARRALRAGLSVAALAASGALLLSACSSSSDASAAGTPSGTPSASGSASAAGVNGKAMDAYRQCLSQHGLNLPAYRKGEGRGRPSGRPSGSPGMRGGYGGGFPGFGGASPDAATQKALDACGSLRPQRDGRGGGADSSAFKAFASCLKDHGVSQTTGSGMRGLNTSDPKTAKAYEACRVLLPQRPSGSGAPSASPTGTA